MNRPASSYFTQEQIDAFRPAGEFILQIKPILAERIAAKKREQERLDNQQTREGMQ